MQAMILVIINHPTQVCIINPFDYPYTVLSAVYVQVECAVQLAEQGCMEGSHAVQGLAGSMHLVERALGPDHPLLAHILLHRARLLRQHQQYHQVTPTTPRATALSCFVNHAFVVMHVFCKGRLGTRDVLICPFTASLVVACRPMRRAVLAYVLTTP